MVNDKTIKEFRLINYVHVFEKSLNYLAGAILAVFAAGIGYIASDPKKSASLFDMIRKIHDNPQKALCVLTAVLSALPYYVYYSLKENTGWNAGNGKRDHLGLAKIGIMYEICIMNCFYLLFQGDTSYAGSKLVISVVNIVLVGLYFYLLMKRSKAGERMGYFVAVIGAAFLFFSGLFFNSLYNLVTHINGQKYSVSLLLLLFLLNSGIHIFYLTKFTSTEETGIISNRIKIMIPVISISTFTVSVTYCFLRFQEQWGIMLFTAFWITGYEIGISCIGERKGHEKITWCVVAFAIFVFGMLVPIWSSEELPDELAVDWLILIGISIYCAAIKYWGYILKFLFDSKGDSTSKDKLMNVMGWYRNSILGSMLLILAVLLSGQRLYILMWSILIWSLLSEFYIYKTAFQRIIKNKNKLYRFGRVIEFFAIVIPVIVFCAESLFGAKLWQTIKIEGIKLPKNTEIFTAALGIVLVLGYILKIWKEKESALIPTLEWKTLVGELVKSFEHLESSSRQTLQNKIVGNFWTTVIMWTVYVILAAFYLCFDPMVSEYRVHGYIIIVFIVVLDWCFLSKCLLDYYIGKMKEGRYIVKFQEVFERKWTECLDTLGEFKETDAEQFKVGDRLRPILFFFGSCFRRYEKLSDKEYEVIAKTACSLELIHKSSVIFDDYIDKDTMRKGVQTFHAQYEDTNILILLGNAMLAKAQINFADCRGDFKCSETFAIKNMQRLSEIVLDLCTGCYKELSRADYDKQSPDEIKQIICLETVSLIKGSLELGYSCFHKDQGDKDREILEKLGEAFGYVFQYLNDLEPFSQKSLYIEHKGAKSNFDYGKKNIAMLILYQHLSNEEKSDFNEHSYENIIALYRKYNIKQTVLTEVKQEAKKIRQLLEDVKAGNEIWVSAFSALFNKALEKKRWGDKIPNL